MSNKDGGPAFPCSEAAVRARTISTRGELQLDQADQMGMTLRDYFAGQSILMASAVLANEKSEQEIDPKRVAWASYVLADAMLAERAK